MFNFPTSRKSVLDFSEDQYRRERRSEALQKFLLDIFYPKLLPIIISVLIGLAAAYLITGEAWLALGGLVVFIPGIIILTRYPFIGILVWLALAPPLADPATLSQLYIFWIYHRLLLPLTLAVIMMSYLFRLKREWPFKWGLPEFALIGMLGYTILSAYVLGDRNFTQNMYRIYDRFFIYLVIYLIMRFSNINKRDMLILGWVCVGQIIFQTTIGLLANFLPSVLPPVWYPPVAAVRTVGSFGAPGHYTSTLALCGVLAFHIGNQINKEKPITAQIFTLSFGLAWLMFLLTYAKSSWLAVTLMLPGLALMYPLQMARLSLIALFLFSTFGGLLADQLYWATQRLENDSTNGRTVANVALMNAIAYSPIYGLGYNNIDHRLIDFKTRVEGFHAKNLHVASHNTYLTIIAELGFIGFVLYTAPIFFWMFMTIKLWPRLPPDGLFSRKLVILLWMAFLCHISVANTADFKDSGIFVVALWWMTLGLIAYVLHRAAEPESHDAQQVVVEMPDKSHTTEEEPVLILEGKNLLTDKTE